VGRTHRAHGGEEDTYRLLVRKPEGRRPLGRQRHRWVDNIKMDLVEIGCGGVNWIGLARDRDKWRYIVNANPHYGRVVRVSGYRSRGPRFNPRCYQIF
jgi:hypothetical protein